MIVAELLERLGAVAPFDKAASWDPVGLQLGDRRAPAHRVAVCHEVTEAVVSQAEATGVDVLVSYHPLLFRPTTALTAGPSAPGRAFRLIRSGVAVIVVHTAFDVAANGTAAALAEELGVESAVGFGPMWPADQVKIVTFVTREHADGVVAAMAGAGAGRIGEYAACAFEVEGTGRFEAAASADPAAGEAGESNAIAELRIEMVAPKASADAVVAALVGAHPYEEPPFDVYEAQSNAGFVGRVGSLAAPTSLGQFADHVRRTLGGVVRFAGDATSRVNLVGCVPGSGGSFLAATGADVVVTGDVSHHQAQGALERGISVVDPGHAATERPGIARLYAAVSEIAPGAIDLTDDPSPWRPL